MSRLVKLKNIDWNAEGRTVQVTGSFKFSDSIYGNLEGSSSYSSFSLSSSYSSQSLSSSYSLFSLSSSYSSQSLSSSYSRVGENLAIALDGGVGPVGISGSKTIIIPRSGTWVNRPTSPFIGQMFFATDLGNGTLFTWNGTSWRPSGNRIRIFSSIVVSGAGESITETIVRTVNIPAGICEVGCVVRLIGVSTWSSTVATAKAIRVKVSNNPSADVSSLSSITNRSRAVISNSGFFGFNKPLIVRSTNQLWTGTINIDQEAVGAEGLTPNFINGIDCTQSWTLWLTHQKPLTVDVFDNQYFIVEIEYP